jgi:flagellar hook-length control protein FliK
MGITVTATLSNLVSAGKGVSNGTGLTDNTIPGAFSALLSDQLSSLASVLGENPGTSGIKENPDKLDKSKGVEDDNASSATDSLLPFLALPASVMAQAPKSGPAKVATEDSGIDADAKGRSPLPAAVTDKEGKHGAEPKDLLTATDTGAKTNNGMTSGSSEQGAANIAGSPSEQQLSIAAAHAESGKVNFQEKLEAATARQEVNVPLHDKNWGQSFNEKIVWAAKNEMQSAQININPPQLGPVQISLQINGDQASAVFASPHAEVRQAIQDSLPQLKEMLAANGIDLGQANVGANLAHQQREMPFQSENGQQRSADETAILPGIENRAEQAVSTPIRRGKGMVDLFA